MTDRQNFHMEVAPGIHFYNQGDCLMIASSNKQFSSLEEPFLEHASSYRKLHIAIRGCKVMPDYILDHMPFEELTISNSALIELPQQIAANTTLRKISLISNKRLTLERIANSLAGKKTMTTLVLDGLHNKLDWKALERLTHIRHLIIGKEMADSLEMSALLQAMARLKNIHTLEFSYNAFRALIKCKEILELKYVREIILPERNICIPSESDELILEDLPLHLCLLDNISIKNYEVLVRHIRGFRTSFDAYSLSNHQYKLLFALHQHDYKAFSSAVQDKIQWCIKNNKQAWLVKHVPRLPGYNKESISSLIADSPFYLNKSKLKSSDKTLHVVGMNTDEKDITALILNRKEFCTVEQLKGFLLSREEKWLDRSDEENLKRKLAMLLASNQDDKYQLAFAMLDGGCGLDRTILSFLAAIYFAHPKKSISRKAGKLFHANSPSLFLRRKRVNCSLKRSGSTNIKLNSLFPDPDMCELSFRLMHHKIAGDNPNIRDIEKGTFHILSSMEQFNLLGYFKHMNCLKVAGLSGDQLAELCMVLEHLPNLKSLHFEKLMAPIPVKIVNARQIQELYAPKCSWEDIYILGEFNNLRSLEISNHPIRETSWLPNLGMLESLSLSRCELKKFPDELEKLYSLQRLVLNTNRIAVIPSYIRQLQLLTVLKLSFNQIEQIPNGLFNLPNLEILELKSNRIHDWGSKNLEDELEFQVSKLNKLDLSNNHITNFNLKEQHFPNLNNLNLSNNELSTLGAGVWQLKNIECLRIHHNQLTQIKGAPCPGRWYIKLVDLSHNQINEIPEFLCDQRINDLNLSYNLIRKLANNGNGMNYERKNWNLEGNPCKK